MNEKLSSAQPVVLREARPEDAERIQAMIAALADLTGDAGRITGRPEDILRYGFGTDRLFECLIATRGDVPVGLCLYFYSYSSWLGEPGVYVQDIYVENSERGHGLGRRLVAAVAARAAEKDATHLRLAVDTGNQDARAFYSAIGMEHREKEMTYHLGGKGFSTMAEAGR